MESSASNATHDGAGAVSALIRVRLGPQDASYAGGLVAGSKALELFADLETELALKEGGNEGLCAGYESVEFLAPLRVGDFVEARAWIVERGNTSRKLQAELHKVLSVDENGVGGVEDPPILAVRARATIVVGARVHAAR
jgi:acyl-CoA hydrolase